MMSLVSWESTVRVFYSRFHSRFAPGFAPDSRSNSISLHHTSSGRFPHSFNANIAHGPTPSHSIPIPTDRPFKAKTESSAHAFPSSCLPQAQSQHRHNSHSGLPNRYAPFEDDPRREIPVAQRDALGQPGGLGTVFKNPLTIENGKADF
jgi:hypothetical protein